MIGASFGACKDDDVLFLFSSTKGEENHMRRIDRQEMVVLAFGWLVALAVTLI